jgi:hypothetical protein
MVSRQAPTWTSVNLIPNPRGSIPLVFTIVRLLVPVLGIRCATLESENFVARSAEAGPSRNEGFRRLSGPMLHGAVDPQVVLVPSGVSVRTREARNRRWCEVEHREIVGSRTGAKLRRLRLSVAPRFLWECLTSRIVSRFPSPASSNRAGRFPALSFPVCFTSRVMWPMHAGWLSANGSNNPVLVKQSECVIQPLRTPPLPAESFAPSGTHQMPPRLLLHPELNVGKAPSRVPYREVVNPTPQNRINKFDQPSYGLADASSEKAFELSQECRPFLRLRYAGPSSIRDKNRMRQ